MKIIITEQQSNIINSLINISAILMKNPKKHFKIGKTGISPEKRFDSTYKKNYSCLIPIAKDDDSSFISKLETILIKDYKEYYPELCDNKNEGESETTEETFNCVYMVIE